MNPQALENLREGKAECPSDLQLDRLQAGELPTDAVQRLNTHIEGCGVCPARLEARRSGFAQFPEVDTRPLLAGIRRGVAAAEERSTVSSWWRRIGLVLAPLTVGAGALALVFLVGRGGPQGTTGTPGGSSDPSGPEVTRLKGGLSLRVYRQAGERSESMLSGERFAPGDRIRFVADLPLPGGAAVVGVESDGDLYVAWPSQDAPAGVGDRQAGNNQELPGAVSLDNSPGRETLYLVHCPDTTGVPRCTSRGANQKPACPAGCAMVPFVINKGS